MTSLLGQPGGGYGDPLERKPELVLEDVIDDYVSIERAEKDYGVVIRALDPDILDYEIDFEATKKSVPTSETIVRYGRRLTLIKFHKCI